MHIKSGAIEKHMRETHNITLTRQIIENNINIIKRCPDRLRLAIAHQRTSSIDQSTGQYFCKDIELYYLYLKYLYSIIGIKFNFYYYLLPDVHEMYLFEIRPSISTSSHKHFFF